MRLLITTIFVFIFLSCCNKTYKLTDTDYDWIPYKGKDTLIFTSASGDRDTLFLRSGKKHMEYEVDPLRLMAPDSTETFYIEYKYNFFDTYQQLNNFRVQELITLKRTKDRITKVGFSILPEGTEYCALKYFDIEYLNKLQQTIFETPQHKYEDALIIESNLSCLSASKIYWSKSNGLVGFDKSNGIRYTLIRKFGL